MFFRVKASNVPKIVNGETYHECNQENPLIQRIMVPDEPPEYYIVEIKFTEKEFNTWTTFCGSKTELIYGK